MYWIEPIRVWDTCRELYWILCAWVYERWNRKSLVSHSSPITLHSSDELAINRYGYELYAHHIKWRRCQSKLWIEQTFLPISNELYGLNKCCEKAMVGNEQIASKWVIYLQPNRFTCVYWLKVLTISLARPIHHELRKVLCEVESIQFTNAENRVIRILYIKI